MLILKQFELFLIHYYSLKPILNTDFLSFYPMSFFCSQDPSQDTALYLVSISP